MPFHEGVHHDEGRTASAPQTQNDLLRLFDAGLHVVHGAGGVKELGEGSRESAFPLESEVPDFIIGLVGASVDREASPFPPRHSRFLFSTGIPMCIYSADIGKAAAMLLMVIP